jgi:FkbH-like protein
MYETEVNQVLETLDEVPAEIQESFRCSSTNIISRTVLPWGEHCTECVWPTCYTTCDMYVPRKDGKCRRFVDGMVRIDHAESVGGYVLKVRFKRWAKLWTVGNTRLFSLAEAKALEEGDSTIANQLNQISDASLQTRQIVNRYYEKKTWAQRPAVSGDDEPDYFLLECYNPSTAPVSVSVTMREKSSIETIPFQQLIGLRHGFNRVEVPMAKIKAVLNTQRPFGIELTPNHDDDELTLYLGTMDFVRERGASVQSPLCKAVVWDLDNTIWEGTLTEDGLEKITVKPGVRRVLAELDRRGILLSVASKNDEEDALAGLRKFGLEEYFLYPQFSWGPKAKAVARIAVHLNIGVNSIIFIDDSAFERAEVGRGCPGIVALGPEEYLRLLDRPEVQALTTIDSLGRRQYYRQQQVREAAGDTHGGTYLDFLRDCQLKVFVRQLSVANSSRVHELTQRTNQMNFSGNRYTKEALEAILSASHLDTYVLDAADRFGSYGTIGFCLVGRRERLIVDLMFSCRIQSKRVEHAFLAYLLRKYRSSGRTDLYVQYRRTPRNARMGETLRDVGFELFSRKGDTSVFVFEADRDIPNDNIVEITDELSGECIQRI